MTQLKSGSMTVDRRFLCSVHISVLCSDFTCTACVSALQRFTSHYRQLRIKCTWHVNFILTEVDINWVACRLCILMTSGCGLPLPPTSPLPPKNFSNESGEGWGQLLPFAPSLPLPWRCHCNLLLVKLVVILLLVNKNISWVASNTVAQYLLVYALWRMHVTKHSYRNNRL